MSVYFIYVSSCRSQKRSWGFPGARVTNSCELLCMVAEIWTLSFERAESPPLRHQAIPTSSNVFLAVYQVMVFRQLLYLGVQKTINWPVLTETQSRFLDSIFTNAIGIFLTINACPFTLPEFEIYIAPNKVWRKALGFPLLLFVMTHFLMSIQDNQDILSLWTPDWKWKQTGSASQKYPECLETTWLLEWIGVWFPQFVLHGAAWSFFSKSWEYEYQVQNAFMLSCRLQYELCSKLHCTATGITEFSVEQRQDLQVGKTIITMYVGVYWAQALCEMYRGAWRLIWHSPWPNRFIAVE